MEKCWSGKTDSVFRYQETVKWGEPWTAQERMTVLLIPVFRFLGDKVTLSGSGVETRRWRALQNRKCEYGQSRLKFKESNLQELVCFSIIRCWILHYLLRCMHLVRHQESCSRAWISCVWQFLWHYDWICVLSSKEKLRQKGEKMSASNKAAGVKCWRLLNVFEQVCVTVHVPV